MKPLAILESALYVNDLEKAKDFYTKIIGLRFHAEKKGRHVFLECGPGVLLLFNPETTKEGDIPHGSTGSGHVAFKIGDEDFEAWREHFRDHGVNIEKEIDWPEGTKSFYFRDPSGNSLELATSKLWGL